ncbi:hypothetical protein GGR57DRAFT_118965 [Xylariaceae sp. FL1272]|nr:hypothetical protein GGR57DRAFT_118965 [Xylariaceae sp. FL1272]
MIGFTVLWFSNLLVETLLNCYFPPKIVQGHYPVFIVFSVHSTEALATGLVLFSGIAVWQRSVIDIYSSVYDMGQDA